MLRADSSLSSSSSAMNHPSILNQNQSQNQQNPPHDHLNQLQPQFHSHSPSLLSSTSPVHQSPAFQSSPFTHSHSQTQSQFFQSHSLSQSQFQSQSQPPSASPSFLPSICNVVATVWLGCAIDLKCVALKARNAEFNPKRLPAVIIRLREPRTTALLFASGKLNVLGACSESAARVAARKYARLIQKVGFPLVKFLDFRIQNMVGTCDVKFPIRLESLAAAYEEFTSYEPELASGLYYKMTQPKLVIIVYVNGKVIILGGKCVEDINEGFQRIQPILIEHRKEI